MTTTGKHEFAVSDALAALRRSWDQAGKLRGEIGAAEGLHLWETHRAHLRGREGLVGSAAASRAAATGNMLHTALSEAVSGEELAEPFGKINFLLIFAKRFNSLFTEA